MFHSKLGGGEEGEGWRENGRGVDKTQLTYWTKDYLLISSSEWIEKVIPSSLPKKFPPLILNETIHNFNGFYQLTFTIIKYNDRPSLRRAINLVSKLIYGDVQCSEP